MRKKMFWKELKHMEKGKIIQTSINSNSNIHMYVHKVKRFDAVSQSCEFVHKKSIIKSYTQKCDGNETEEAERKVYSHVYMFDGMRERDRTSNINNKSQE